MRLEWNFEEVLLNNSIFKALILMNNILFYKRVFFYWNTP